MLMGSTNWPATGRYGYKDGPAHWYKNGPVVDVWHCRQKIGTPVLLEDRGDKFY